MSNPPRPFSASYFLIQIKAKSLLLSLPSGSVHTITSRFTAVSLSNQNSRRILSCLHLLWRWSEAYWSPFPLAVGTPMVQVRWESRCKTFCLFFMPGTPKALWNRGGKEDKWVFLDFFLKEELLFKLKHKIMIFLSLAWSVLPKCHLRIDRSYHADTDIPDGESIKGL